MDLNFLKEKGLRGESVTREEAEWLAVYPNIDIVCDAANDIRHRWQGDMVDSCSIVNARSGMCGEDCKWCAQSKHYNTGCDTYSFIDPEDVKSAAQANEKEGIRRFSLVTSGRKVSKKDMEKFCEFYNELSQINNLYLCASMGLLGEEELKMLHDAGVKRYHCNMETSEKVFRKLCSSHSPKDKRETIRKHMKLAWKFVPEELSGWGRV